MPATQIVPVNSMQHSCCRNVVAVIRDAPLVRRNNARPLHARTRSRVRVFFVLRVSVCMYIDIDIYVQIWVSEGSNVNQSNMYRIGGSSVVLLLCLLSSSMVTAIDPLCKWYGIAPLCFIGNSCPENCWQVTNSERGDGLTCWFGQKNYCCCVKQVLDSIVNAIVPN